MDSLQDGWLGKAAGFHHSLDTASPTPKCFTPNQPSPLCLVERYQNLAEKGCVLLGAD
jgi:hypothetical protein